MHIELRDIHKYYGPVHANRGIHIKIATGSIHGILGENGAGKSTLMKILSGYIPKSSGAIRLDGKQVDYQSPAEANRLGIGMLYQDPLDFPPLSVIDNFMLGQCKGWRLNPEKYRIKLKELARSFGFHLEPDFPVEKLTVGERQQLEILRLLALGVQVLILDEPTTGISSTQKELLFQALRQLTAEGKSILLVSHKLEDIEALCHRVTVLRYGEVTGEMDHPFQTQKLLELMFGSPPAPPPRCGVSMGETLLSFHDVSASGGRAGLQDCTVSIHQGEVAGLAGLEGSGQGVFLRLAAGLQSPHQGKITFRNHDMSGRDHLAFKQAGVAFLPASRLEEGLISGLTLTEHFVLAFHHRSLIVPWEEAHETAQNRIEQFRIKGSPHSPSEALSGGNQQRLLLSLIPPNPRLLLLEQPTRGLDMESAHWVWQRFHQYCAENASLVFSSAELDEILAVADRVLVFFNGRIVKDVKTENTDLAELGRAIAGKGVRG
jgi:simple sugar transport system ATP-binding protein